MTLVVDPAEVQQTDKFLLPDVRIIGCRSKNKSNGKPRIYPPATLKAALPLFEGASVNVDHEFSKHNRPYEDRIGYLRNVRWDETDPADPGLIGDLQLNPHHALAESVQWDYLNATKKIGLSFYGEGPTVDGKVTHIDTLYSVDIVQNPGTNTSLRESELAEAEEENPFEKRLAACEACNADHHSRLAECENCIRECMGKSESEEIRTKLGNLLVEVEQLRKPVIKAVHNHPNLNQKPTETDIKEFVRSITRKP